MGSPASPKGFVSRLGARGALISMRSPLRAFTGTSRTPPGYPSPSPRRSSAPRRHGNVRPLRIGYAYRPRLSSRLTLGGLALPRNPWAYGGGVSRPSLATHASILTPAPSTAGRPAASPRAGSSPTAGLGPARRFGASLSPVYCRRMSTRPVSCYALFECMAASKPTSWLSGRTHILCHSAMTWGP